MQAARLATRLQREIRMLESDPPPGVCAWPCDDSLSHLQAQIQGPDGTVYAKGLFKLEVRVPERYPFEPPNVKFTTPIYHPNIDSGGRICLDILNMPPKGSWKPSMNIPTVLASIGLLLAEPNPDDGLMGDITAEYKHNRLAFDMMARNWTDKYARQEESSTGDNCARHPVVPENVQQNPSKVNVKSLFSRNVGLEGNHDRRQPKLIACQQKPLQQKHVLGLEGNHDRRQPKLIACQQKRLQQKHVLRLERNHDRRQPKLIACQQVQSSTTDRMTVTNKFDKCSLVSNPKLNLGAKLSLEKGSKEVGKQSPDFGPVDVCAVTSKRAFASIKNTVGTRQIAVQESPPSKKTLAESVVVGKRGNGTDMRPEHKENSPVVEGSETFGSSAVYSHKVKSSESFIEFGIFKRPREGRASPPSGSSPKSQTQRTCSSDKDKLSLTATTSTLVAAVDSECLEKGSKCAGFSFRPLRNFNTQSDELPETGSNLAQDGPTSGSVLSDTGPVRIPMTCSNPVNRVHVLDKNQVRSFEQTSTAQKPSVETPAGMSRPCPPRSSTKAAPAPTQEGTAAQPRDEADQASGSTAQKRSVETPEGRSSPCHTKSSGKVAEAPRQEGTSAQPRDEAGTHMQGRSANAGSSYKSIDKYLIRTSVAQCPSIRGQDMLVAKYLSDRPGAGSTTVVSGNVQSTVELESRGCQSAKVDVVILPDEIDPGLKKASESVTKMMVEKPPLPAKPITDIIVLDSESDEEPPKGRSRLSLSRRKVVRSKTKV